MTTGEYERHSVETFFVWASQHTVNLGSPSPPRALTRTDLASKGGGPSPPIFDPPPSLHGPILAMGTPRQTLPGLTRTPFGRSSTGQAPSPTPTPLHPPPQI